MYVLAEKNWKKCAFPSLSENLMASVESRSTGVNTLQKSTSQPTLFNELRTFAGIEHVTFIIPWKFFYDAVSLTFVNTLNVYLFFGRNTQNHEKHEHIEHIMRYMFHHRKLMVVSMRYIYITLLDAWWFPFFFGWINSFTDSLLTDQKERNSERWKLSKRCFDHRSYTVFAQKGLGRFLAWKKVFNYDNLLNGSIQIEFHHSVFFPLVGRLSFFSKSKWTRGRLQWPNLFRLSMVYHTAYLRNKRDDPQ